MRFKISIIVSTILFVSVIYLAYSGKIALLDYWTGLAIFLTSIAIGVLYWGFKPYIKRSFEKTSIQDSKKESAPFVKMDEDKSELQPAKNRASFEHHIDDNLLDQIYEKAHQKTVDIYHDAKLSYWGVIIYPFRTTSNTTILLDFYSKWADKKSSFHYNVSSRELKHMLPDRVVKMDFNRTIYKDLPWKKSPKWKDIIKKAYPKIGPFPADNRTYAHLWAVQEQELLWYLKFDDHFSGKTHSFHWDGRRLDEKSLKLS